MFESIRHSYLYWQEPMFLGCKLSTLYSIFFRHDDRKVVVKANIFCFKLIMVRKFVLYCVYPSAAQIGKEFCWVSNTCNCMNRSITKFFNIILFILIYN